MLFKLSLKNISKSFKDYTIYFLTLALGIAIFYMFNSMDAQTAMLNLSASTQDIIKMMINILSAISVFIAIVLGFLIVYANNFLIKRRKKEFGIYMTLGMGRRQISKIILLETVLVGIISLAVGLVVGVFASQLMSVVVAKMFEVDMKKYEFVFSSAAMIKTMIYFGIMYVAVLIFNTIAISKYKLIDLLTASRKNEKIKIKNTFVCVIVFLISIAMLAWAYYTVTINFKSLIVASYIPILRPIIAGCIGTFLFFWSSSGFILKLIQANKKTYLKGTNMFVLRQINAKINTTVVSMTLICLMLFVTICVLSSAVSINNSLNKSLRELTPVDINIEKQISKKYKNESIDDSLKELNIDKNKFKDSIETKSYETPDVTLASTLGDSVNEAVKDNPFLRVDSNEDIMRVSDYNNVAKLYGKEQFTLKDNEYMIVSNYQDMENIRNVALNKDQKINILSKEYTPKYNECKDGFIMMTGNPCNLGIILVPDSCNLTDNMVHDEYFIANYNANTDDEKQSIEKTMTNTEIEDAEDDIGVSTITKLEVYADGTGVSTMVIFIALYLGIIFLIASSAILALKELSESSDNKQRYSILRKIGTDEEMLNETLFRQIGIFFLIPLVLAIVHSIFGIQFALKTLSSVANMNDLAQPITYTAVFITLIYGGYFLATYLCSKNIIKEDQ